MAKTISHGEVSGSATAKQLPAKQYQNGWLQAAKSNAGNVYVGSSNAVTLPDGTTDTTTGICLVPGAFWVLGAPGSLNDFWIICDNATDDLLYLVENF